MLRAGADKISLNTAAIRRPEFIREASRAFGSSTIVVSIEAIRQPDGKYHCYTDCGREQTGIEAVEWATRAAELGAGELLVVSVDREGTGKGYDLELTRSISQAVSIPVIACGGAGRVEHLVDVVKDGKADAVSLASVLHYHYVRNHGGDGTGIGAEGNTEFLKNRGNRAKIHDASLGSIKTAASRRPDSNADGPRVAIVAVLPPCYSQRPGGSGGMHNRREAVMKRTPRVAIVDYALGNLFSVLQACSHVGLDGFVTSDKNEVLAADAVILPGVGAYGDAMDSLTKLDLAEPLRDIAARGTPLFGICLGQQLLMTESYEFGRHKGLGLIDGPVVRFEKPQVADRVLKVPQVGWNRIHRPDRDTDPWTGSPLANVTDGECMYFVHSFYVKPTDPNVVLSTTSYGNIDFCSGIRRANVMAFQFHPERSGVVGMRIYKNLADLIAVRTEEYAHAA